MEWFSLDMEPTGLPRPFKAVLTAEVSRCSGVETDEFHNWDLQLPGGLLPPHPTVSHFFSTFYSVGEISLFFLNLVPTRSGRSSLWNQRATSHPSFKSFFFWRSPRKSWARNQLIFRLNRKQTLRYGNTVSDLDCGTSSSD